jgi:HAD superfamily hydrolase (TIGR01493 family)
MWGADLKIKALAFDLFGTLFDMSGASPDELKDYLSVIREPVWRPFDFPRTWTGLKPFPDVAEGLKLLDKKDYGVVTMSNAPFMLQQHLIGKNNLKFDALIPLELRKVYKPNPEAYKCVLDLLRLEPGEVMMVTANRTFGDLEASASLGMYPMLIRDGDGPKDLIELAKQLGC